MATPAKVRAGLRLEATTTLLPTDALGVVREVATQAKGDGSKWMTSGVWVGGERIHIEREAPDRLIMSINTGKRLFELCTFSARVAASGSDGKTNLSVGGLESYKTTQSTVFMIPISQKRIVGFDLYQRFLDMVAATLRERDSSAQVVVQMPS